MLLCVGTTSLIELFLTEQKWIIDEKVRSPVLKHKQTSNLTP